MQPSADLVIVNDITANDSLLLWLYCNATFSRIINPVECTRRYFEERLCCSFPIEVNGDDDVKRANKAPQK